MSEIEQRVIATLIKTKIVGRDSLGRWVVAPSWNNLVSHPELFEAQVGVADDLDVQEPTRESNDLEVAQFYTGHLLDTLAARYGIGRDPEMFDDTFRPHVIAAIKRKQGGAFDRQESLADHDGEFPPPPSVHLDGLDRPFIMERRNGEEYRGVKTVAEGVTMFAPAIDPAPVAQPNEFRRRLKESLSDDPDPDGFETFVRDFEGGNIKGESVKTIPIDEFPARPSSSIGTEPSPDLMAARFAELHARVGTQWAEDAIDFARWYHAYRVTGLGAPQ